MSFKPLPCTDRWHGVLALLAILAFDFLAISQVVRRAIDGLSFLLAVCVLASILLLFYIGYRSVGAFTMEYWVDRDGVTLRWGATQQVVPMGIIRRIQRGGKAGGSRRKPWHWPCPERRRCRCEGLGVVNSYASRPLDQQLILVTDGESYGISPVDPEGFLGALQERFALGVARVVPPELRRPPLWTWSLWRDRAALFLIGAGLVGVLILFGSLSVRFPNLSSDLPLHFDVAGLPDRIAPKMGLFALPTIGLLAWGANLIAGIWTYRRVQAGSAYLLWGGALVVEVIAGIALFNLMRW